MNVRCAALLLAFAGLLVLSACQPPVIVRNTIAACSSGR